MPALILFPAGMILGSFVSVIAHRLPRGESFAGRALALSRTAAPRSPPTTTCRCSPGCGLRGRCRSCGEPISPRYPLTEIGLGALYVGTFLALGDGDLGELALGLILCTVLVAITLTDLELRLIPNKIVLAGAVAGLAIVAAHRSGEPRRAGDRRRGRGRSAVPGRARLPAGDGDGRREAGGDDRDLSRARRRPRRCWSAF